MTFQQDFFDAMIRHQVDLLRFGAGLSKRVHGLLDATEEDIRAEIEKRLRRVNGITPATLARLQRLEKAIAATRLRAWKNVNALWVSELLEVAKAEPHFVAGTIETLSPFQVDTSLPGARVIQAAVLSKPFQGRNLREWAKSAEQSDIRRMHQQIRIGVVNGEPIRRIVSRVLGAKGVTHLTRLQATAVTRTAVNHVSNAARQVFAEENRDIAPQELFVATLDSRTTVVCMGNDGKRFKVGSGPKPPLHVGCRSTRVPLLDGEVLGERPFKAVTEQQLLREYAQRQGLAAVPRSRKLLPRGHKGSFDRFARQRSRELTGQLPAKESYQDWLSRQTKDFQSDVLGAKRAKLFRQGKLKLDRFTDAKGRELTLDQLRQRYPKQWRKSGLGDGGTGGPPGAPPPPPPPPPPRSANRPGVVRSRAVPDGVTMRVTSKITGKRYQADILDALNRAGFSRFYSKESGRKLDLVLTGSQRARANAFDDHVNRGASGEFYRTKRGNSLKVLTSQELEPTAPMGEAYSVPVAATTLREQIRRTALHEFGHAVHLHGNLGNIGPTDAIAAKADSIVEKAWRTERDWISPYSIVNRNEYFAEAFAAYHSEGDWMRTNAPNAYRMVENVLRLRELL